MSTCPFSIRLAFISQSMHPKIERLKKQTLSSRRFVLLHLFYRENFQLMVNYKNKKNQSVQRALSIICRSQQDVMDHQFVAMVVAAMSSTLNVFQFDHEPKLKIKDRLEQLYSIEFTSIYLATHRSIHTDSPDKIQISQTSANVKQRIPLLNSESLYLGRRHFL